MFERSSCIVVSSRAVAFSRAVVSSRAVVVSICFARGSSARGSSARSSRSGGVSLSLFRHVFFFFFPFFSGLISIFRL